jgi:hypothetical protein
MKANISMGECIIRIILSVLFAAIMGGVFHGWIALLGLLALYPFVTGLGGWDPIYAMRLKHTNEDSPYEDHDKPVVEAPVMPAKRTASAAA